MSNAPTLAGWKKAAVHPDVMCPSGMAITIRILNLPAMVKTGVIPQHLLDAALDVAKGGTTIVTPELIAQQEEVTNLILVASVVEPKLTLKDCDDIPYEDKDFIVAVATRQRDLDELGKHVAGLTSSADFRRFRKLGEFDPDVASLQGGWPSLADSI